MVPDHRRRPPGRGGRGRAARGRTANRRAPSGAGENDMSVVASLYRAALHLVPAMSRKAGTENGSGSPPPAAGPRWPRSRGSRPDCKPPRAVWRRRKRHERRRVPVSRRAPPRAGDEPEGGHRKWFRITAAGRRAAVAEVARLEAGLQTAARRLAPEKTT